MKIDFNSLTPIYVQIAEGIEEDIAGGILAEGSAVYSQLVIARELNVNPATAAKGINVLVAKGILEKQRGASMVVAKGAVERLTTERLTVDFDSLVAELVGTAKKMGMPEVVLMETVIKKFRGLGG